MTTIKVLVIRSLIASPWDFRTPEQGSPAIGSLTEYTNKVQDQTNAWILNFVNKYAYEITSIAHQDNLTMSADRDRGLIITTVLITYDSMR